MPVSNHEIFFFYNFGHSLLLDTCMYNWKKGHHEIVHVLASQQ